MRHVAALLLVAAACGKDGGKRIQRDRDAGAAAITRDPGSLGRTDEKEPNNDAATASALPPGHVARGTLDGETDVDVYRVSVAAEAELRVGLSGIDGVDLALELRDAAGAVLAKSDRGPALTIEGFPNFHVRRGDYLLYVKEFVKPRKKPKVPKPKKGQPPPPDAGPDPRARVGLSNVYELTVEVFETGPLQEVEPDDEPATAVEVMLGDSVRGWIGWSGDVDVWKVPLEGMAPQYALDVEVTGLDGVALTVQVEDAGGRAVLVRKGTKGGGVSIRGLVPALDAGAAPYHLVRISGDRSNPESPYDLRITTRLLDDDEEAEPNDTAARATPLRTDVTVTSGAMRAGYALGDVDRFVLPALTEPGLLDVGVEPPTGVAIELELAAGDAKLAGGSAAKVGERIRLTGVSVPAGAPLVVTVKAAKPGSSKSSADGGETRPYRLTWSLSAAEDLPMPPEEPSDASVDELPPEEEAQPIDRPE